ncbi:MAG: septum formation inhibitor Maf [Flavobacteriaceae bacterium]
MRFITFLSIVSMLISCKTNQESEVENQVPSRVLSNEFKEYWFNGQAEITSYSLEQERYGEIRTGTAVLIFVTEDFLPDVQVKANIKTETTQSVLKLNKTKNFNTGIYPYSIMSSVFYPLEEKNHALKVTHSIQEWCGHVYAQLNNRNDFEIKSHSYFEGEADQEYNLTKTHLEDEIWTQIRVDPSDLPVGEIEIIPSMEFSRLRHKEFKAYKAIASLEEIESSFEYSINYPELDRTLTIWFESASPYHITKWTEQIGESMTQATFMKKIQSAYWSKNQNKDAYLRDSLQLN